MMLQQLLKKVNFMGAKIISGKDFSSKVREKVREQVAHLKETHGLVPGLAVVLVGCLLYTSPSPRDKRQSRMPSSA